MIRSVDRHIRRTVHSLNVLLAAPDATLGVDELNVRRPLKSVRALPRCGTSRITYGVLMLRVRGAVCVVT